MEEKLWYQSKRILKLLNYAMSLHSEHALVIKFTFFCTIFFGFIYH
jgi:hypothetical protein